MATDATPGSGLPFWFKVAVSPITKMFGWPGTVRSLATLTCPLRSISAPSHARAGEAFTPAVQMTVLARMRSPATMTPLLVDGSDMVSRSDVSRDLLVDALRTGWGDLF